MIDALLVGLLIREVFVLGLFGLTRLSARSWLVADSPPPGIVIVVPVYEETRTVAVCAAWFVALAVGRPWLKLIICGTARERTAGINPTLALAKEALGNTPGTYVVEAPREFGSRAAQINWAIGHTGLVGADDFVGMYDVDSRPQAATLDEVRARHEEADVLQQHAIFTANFGRLRANLLLLGQACYQTRWTMLHECGRFTLYKWGLWPAVHLVGHGMFIRAQLLDHYGGVPAETDIEDAHLGFYLSCQGERIVSLRAWDVSDNPERLEDWWAQIYGWSKGPREALAYARLFKAKFRNGSMLRIGLVTLATLLAWARWALTSAVFLVAAIAALSGNPIALTWVVLWVGGSLLVMRLANRVSQVRASDTVLGLLGLPLYVAVASMPVMASAIDALMGRKPARYRTAHY